VNTFVIDVSIAIKWVVEEDGTAGRWGLHQRAKLMPPNCCSPSARTSSGKKFRGRAFDGRIIARRSPSPRRRNRTAAKSNDGAMHSDDLGERGLLQHDPKTANTFDETNPIFSAGSDSALIPTQSQNGSTDALGSHSSSGSHTASSCRLPTRKLLFRGLRRSKTLSANRIWRAWRQRIASYRLSRSSA